MFSKTLLVVVVVYFSSNFSHSNSQSTVIHQLNEEPPTHYKLVCYYMKWSWYRPGIGKYSSEDIDPSLCTHIVYAYAVLGDDGLITGHDSGSDYDTRFYERVVEFKRYGIKVSLAIGGWNDSAGDKYSKLVNDSAARARFVSHVVPLLEKYGFDGLDLVWEYPKCWQNDCSKGPDSDKQGFADLVLELSAKFKPKGLLLSAAVSPSQKVIDAAYDVPVLARHLDWIAVMTYNYHGQWDKRTGHVAPLYCHRDPRSNANYTIHYWMQKGAPANKLIMGMPIYGHTFTLGADKDLPQTLSLGNEATGLNAPALAGGKAGEYTRAKGFLSYYEICDRIRYYGWKVVKDPNQRMGPYAYKGNQWVSFDDIEIIKKKVNFIKSLGLAGGMIWALDLDDFRNRCGQGKYPLVNAIKNDLLDSSVDKDTTILSDPIIDPPNEIDENLDDIQVRPVTKLTPRPTQITTHTQPMVDTTTKKPTTAVSTNLEERYKVVCYYTNSAWYRPGPGKYTPSDIDPSLCTHIVYAFAVLDTKLLVIKPLDMWLDIENKFYEKVVSLKEKGVKVVLGIGGWDDSASDKYSRMVNSPSARKKFVIHALQFIEQYEFDGLDLNWEYPKCWHVNCEKGPSFDKQNFASLVKELRAAFKPRGLLLSAAVSANKRVIDAGYDVATLSKNLDWISLMTYNYHGQWDNKTGHVSPMYASDGDIDKTLNTNFTVHYWIEKGAAPEKLILGVPFYGLSFSLEENAGTGLGVPSYAGGDACDETRDRGFLSFYEICDRIRMKGWQVFRDPSGRMGPYASFYDQWVSFDDDFMVRHKAEYVRSMGLGGSMVWSLDLDDFSGRNCGCGKSPLLATINHVLRGSEAPPTCSLEEYGQSDKKFFRKDYTYLEASKGFYKIHTLPKSWIDAKRVCALEEASLFYPENDNEAHAVISFWNATQPFWSVYVGISDLLVKGVFESIHGQPLSDVYHKWGASEPNNRGGFEDCVILFKDGTLNDDGCNKKKPFICKKSLLSLEWNQQGNIPNLDGQGDEHFFRTDYTYLETVEGYYKFHLESRNWAAAKQTCALEGASLFFPENDDEAHAVISFWNKTHSNTSRVYVGLSNFIINELYETTDGKTISEVYNNWGPGEPTEGTSTNFCVYLDKHGYLYDTKACEARSYPFICKKSLQSVEWDYDCNMSNLDYTFNENLGKCYKLHTAPLNWRDAHFVCRAEQSYLAVIDTPMEAEYLVNLTESASNLGVQGLYQKGIYHLGIHNTFKEGWWTVQGKRFNDASAWWGNYQPGRGDEKKCGSMFYTGRLHNIDCNTKSFFICEHDINIVYYEPQQM